MKQLYATGTPVVVEMPDGAEYPGQVVFAHFGDVPRVFVAWWTDAPVGCHPVADWVHADRVRCADHGALAR